MAEQHEVVISGIGGRFPSSSNMDELKENLFNKINMVQEKRWKEVYDLESYMGGVKDIFMFDLTYFGIYRKHADYMDPSTKKVLECAIEAIHDSGMTLPELAGSNTATITGGSINDVQIEISRTIPKRNYILMYACSMCSNRLAYFLDLRGPSFYIHSDWNGGMNALEYARNLIATGRADSAVVATNNYIFMPAGQYHFERLGLINTDGQTKSFSDNADGYSRAESIVVFFLQRSQDAIRKYGTLLSINLSAQGSRMVPMSASLPLDPDIALRAYKKAGVDPSDLAYLEATGTASKTLDAAELNLLSDILFKKRQKELPIGSIKSNLGSTDSCAAMLALVKLLIAADTGIIPPNLHYSSPNKLVPALLSGKLKVVTEPTALEGDLLALNNVNVTGGYVHAIIRRHDKPKKRVCAPGELPPDNIPRLVVLSGRDENQLRLALEKVEKMPIDEEFLALIYRTFGRGIKNHIYRGYTLLHKDLESKKFKEIEHTPIGGRKQLWILCSGMGSQWPGMAAKLMSIPTFANSLQRCHDLLKPYGVDLLDVISNPKPDMFSSILNCFIGITAVQIGLIDVIKELGIVPDGIIGHSVGEVGCAYMDGSFTLEQAILTSYKRGLVSAESKISGGQMAAVGKGYKELKDMLPEGIDIACRNSSTSSTISGPAELVSSFMKELDEKGIFNRAVASTGIPYHSRYIKDLGTRFLETVKDIIPSPKLRSPKWISTSVPEKDWDKDEAKYSSAEYHTNNLLKPVLFEEGLEHVPKDAIIVEVAPRGLLKAIMERALPNATYINLTSVGDEGDLTLLAAFGRIYNTGIRMEIQKLYPPVEFPVSRGTPSISSLFNWVHTEEFNLWNFNNKVVTKLDRRELHFRKQEKSTSVYDSFSNYCLGDTPFIPAAVYLDLIIDMFNSPEVKGTQLLLTDTTIKKIVKYGDYRIVHAALYKDKGNWQITHEDRLVNHGDEDLAVGCIEVNTEKEDYFESFKELHVPDVVFTQNEIYEYLLDIGLSVNYPYQNISKISVNNDFTSGCAEIIWKDSLLLFLESLFTFLAAFESFKHDRLHLLRSFFKLYLNLDEFKLESNTVVKVYYNSSQQLVWGDGITLQMPYLVPPSIDYSRSKSIDFKFPVYCTYADLGIETKEQLMDICVKLIENEWPRDKEIEMLKILVISENTSNFEEVIHKCKSKFQIGLTTAPDDSALLFIEKSNTSNDVWFIWNSSDKLENSLKVISHSHTGFLISTKKVESPGFLCVLRRTWKDTLFYFYKSVNPQKVGQQWSQVVLNSPQWETNLKTNLEKKNVSVVYVVGYSQSMNYAKMVIQKCSTLKHEEKIRYFFIEKVMGSMFEPEMYKEQISKDLKINIHRNGKWGTFLYHPIALPKPMGGYQRRDEFVYQFQNIKAEGIQLKTLGMNLTGLSTLDEKLGVFEFCGIRNGKEICGLAKLDEPTQTLELDPVLVWNKPSGWSDEDLTSVLLMYSMAYYMLEKIDRACCLTKYILLHNGENPLCQAVAQLALKRGFEIITTYNGDIRQKKLIQQLLPEVDEGNILKVDTELSLRVLINTKSKGVLFVLNTSDEDISLTMPLLTWFQPRLFQVSSKPTEHGKSLGLRAFLSNLGFFGFGPELLLDLHEVDKKRIWDLMENGFKTELKPLNKIVISSGVYNLDAVSMLKETNCAHKVITRMNTLRTSFKFANVHPCDNEKYHIILGNENLVWHDLIQWLKSRGARKIIVAANNISPLFSKRIQIFLRQNKHMELNICSAEKLQNPDGVNNFINEIQSGSKIESIFIFGKEYYEAFSDVSGRLIDTEIVAVGKDITMNNGNTSISRKHVILSVPDESNLRSIIENLDALINTSEPILTADNPYNSGDTTIYMEFWEHYPDSVEDIAYLARCSGKAGWEEVRTSTLPYRYCKDVTPVFVIPPLKRGQINKLMSNLMHPAFSAVIPEDFDNLQQLALDLFKGMQKLISGVVTIICADWGYHLGFYIAKLLEENEKKVSLILLDVSKTWACTGALDVIHSKISRSIQIQKPKNMDLIERGFKILKNCMEKFSSSSHESNQYQGLCYVFSNKALNEDALNPIKEICSQTVMVHTTKEIDYPYNVNSLEAANIINAAVRVDVRDMAYPVERGYDHEFVYQHTLKRQACDLFI